jgi:putative ABC transport system permease protein
MVISTGALVGSFAMGVGVTVLSAWLPARRAAGIAPIAALREVSVDNSGASVRRAVLGMIVTAGAVGSLMAGLAAGSLALVGLGALGTFVGVSVLGPVLARPLARVLGFPLRFRGMGGELATRNAMRNPKRTARTAASLMIGVGLVGFITVFAASAKTSVAGSLEEDFSGSHILRAGGYDNSTGLSPQLADDLRHTPGVDAVAESRLTPAIIDGEPTEELFAFSAGTIGQLFDLGSVQGDVRSLGADGIAVSSEEATDRGWTIGSSVPVTFPSGDATFTVEAIYSGGTDWLGPMFLDFEGYQANVPDALDFEIYVAGDEAAIETTAAAYPSAQVQDTDGYLDVINSEIDTILGLFYALLALAVLIALLGIANTLALSIFERTREIGLLRAVGMTRSQVRSAVRWESIIIAIFGTTLGLGIGTFFGWAIVRALADEGIDTLTVPVNSLLVVTVIAGIAGALAAVVPARRAARLDVLDALTMA